MRVVVAGGGTAGHVTPAIALAKALEGDDVTFVGTATGVESALVPRAGFPLEYIEVVGFDRSRPLGLPRVAMRAAGAVARSRRILRALHPDVVVGMGGYVSLPVSLAAAAARLPLVLHEQNIVFGLAHKVTKPLAARVAVSFKETLRDAGKKGAFTGNPVQPEFATANLMTERQRGYESFGLEPERQTILVFGGSLGAKRVTDAALGLGGLWADRAGIQILHILGRRGGGIGPPDVRGLIYRTIDYVDRMIEAYAVADVAVCRGGASTVAELTVVGVPSVIVPYPYHRDRQQELHGRVLEAAGAAKILPDGDATPAALAGCLEPLLNDRAALDRMRAAARSLGKPEAAHDLARIVRSVAA
ncbi:MAG: undecaprenyldiphospho-muramoylpentapeptide beta-N-acetylglucosaminyltransferase [Actinobacteria bacterium]|nr:undecaprenyldiphospho-muramoylpentapeptide beta-N-acetylglucosaminyltransferase [Actinomycetota bacterium]